MDVGEENRKAWNRRVELFDRWTLPVDGERIARARQGAWRIVLTPNIGVPRAWLEPVADADMLALASGGGQQAPILAAAGARVTVLDASDAQLAQDRLVAEREGLELRLERGDMRDLSRFADASFDVIVHPISNCFVADARQVWRECTRVLRPGGRLLAGFCNPVLFIFDADRYEAGELVLRHRVPSSDLEIYSEAELSARVARGEPIEFGHTFDDQLGGQLEAGLVLTGLYEDNEAGLLEDRVLSRHLPCFMATCAVKPASPDWWRAQDPGDQNLS
jgi:SAM-dependent methyltransferase